MERLSAIYCPDVGVLRHTCATRENARTMLGDMLANGEVEPGARVIRLPRGGTCPSCGGRHVRRRYARGRTLPTRWAESRARGRWGRELSYLRNASPCVGGEAE